MKRNRCLSYTLTTILLTGTLLGTHSVNAMVVTIPPILSTRVSQTFKNDNFEAKLNDLTKYLNKNIGNVTSGNLQSKINDPKFANNLAQWQLITQTGAGGIRYFCKRGWLPSGISYMGYE